MTENTQKKQSPTPIQDWENRDVDGKVKVYKKAYDAHVAKVAELRERQMTYEASLPKDPTEALIEIHRIGKDMRDFAEPEYAVRASLEILMQLASNGGLQDIEYLKDTVYWLLSQALDGLSLIEDSTDRVHDIARQFHPAHRPFEA